MSRTIIATAAETTDVVQKRVELALKRLDQSFSGRIVNGFGVYADPAEQKRALAAAIELLNGALQCIHGTIWPSAQDYEDV